MAARRRLEREPAGVAPPPAPTLPRPLPSFTQAPSPRLSTNFPATHRSRKTQLAARQAWLRASGRTPGGGLARAGAASTWAGRSVALAGQALTTSAACITAAMCIDLAVPASCPTHRERQGRAAAARRCSSRRAAEREHVGSCQQCCNALQRWCTPVARCSRVGGRSLAACRLSAPAAADSQRPLLTAAQDARSRAPISAAVTPAPHRRRGGSASCPATPDWEALCSCSPPPRRQSLQVPGQAMRGSKGAGLALWRLPPPEVERMRPMRRPLAPQGLAPRLPRPLRVPSRL
jgi:hypothetical protein